MKDLRMHVNLNRKSSQSCSNSCPGAIYSCWRFTPLRENQRATVTPDQESCRQATTLAVAGHAESLPHIDSRLLHTRVPVMVCNFSLRSNDDATGKQWLFMTAMFESRFKSLIGCTDVSSTPIIVMPRVLFKKLSTLYLQ